jgi:hypothetical protein
VCTEPIPVWTLRLTHEAVNLLGLRSAVAHSLFQQSTFDVTIPDAINVVTAPFRVLLQHSVSCSLVEGALGGSQTVEISPGQGPKLVSKVPGIW